MSHIWLGYVSFGIERVFNCNGQPTPILLCREGKKLPSEFKRPALEAELDSGFMYFGIVPRDHLPGLYYCADILLFPSFYEGFGWPPLEAMACGTPVVASNVASLPEVMGDPGLMVPPDDYKGLAEAMYAVLTDEGLRQSLVKKGLARARQFTWEETAQKTLTVYERVV